MLYSPRVRKHCFNLVEIITALAVIAIIVVTAMSLIPHGMQNNQNAVSRMAASDVGDQFLNFFASRLEYNWDELNALPSKDELLDGEHTDGDEVYHNISMMMYSKVVTNPDGTVKKIPVYPSVRIYYHLKNGVNRSWSEYKGGDGPHSGLFHVQSANNMSYVDFDGYVR